MSAPDLLTDQIVENPYTLRPSLLVSSVPGTYWKLIFHNPDWPPVRNLRLSWPQLDGTFADAKTLADGVRRLFSDLGFMLLADAGQQSDTVTAIMYPEGMNDSWRSKLKDDYDFIIIDCSPSLGLITINSLTAADSVIVPVQCEYFALEGLGKLLNTIKIVQTRLNPELSIEGMLLTMYDQRLRLANQVIEEVKMHFQQLVFDTIIHRNTRLGEAPSHGESIIMHDASSTGAVNYLNLAREILQKNEMTRISDKDKIVEIYDGES